MLLASVLRISTFTELSDTLSGLKLHIDHKRITLISGCSVLPWHCGWSGEKQVGRQTWGRRQRVWRAGDYLHLLLHHHCSSPLLLLLLLPLLLPRSHWPCHPQGPCAAGRESCRGCCVESYWRYWRQKKIQRGTELRGRQRKLLHILSQDFAL